MFDLQDNNQGTAENLLYQENPGWTSRNPYRVPASFTESMQSYMKAARHESWIHENNYRVPNLEIILRFFVVLPVEVIKQNWKRLRRNLKQAEVTYAAVIELTDGSNGKPNNTIHYHFLIDTNLDSRILKDLMTAICLKSKLGVYGLEFDLIYPNAGITDWGSNKINYFTKFGYSNKVHLFRVGLRVKKFYYSTNWFIDMDGTPTKKSIILKRLKNSYKEKKGQIVLPSACPILAQYNGTTD